MYVCSIICIVQPICIRTERVNEEILPPKEKAYLHAKLQVLLLLLLTSSCTVMYVRRCGMHCNVKYVSFTSSKRGIILHNTFQKEEQFPCKFLVRFFTQFSCVDIRISCIIMYCED